MFANLFPASGEPPVTSSAPAACNVFTLAARLRATPDESKVPGVVLSSFAFTPAMNCSAASPANKIIKPGLVQNCPPAMRQLPENSSTIFAPRSASAPGKITTGFKLDISTINRFADGVRRRFKFHTRRAAAGEADCAEPFVGDHSQTVLRRDVVNHLHSRGRQIGFAHRGNRLFREQPRRVRMTRMRLGDDRISRRNRRRKIAAADSVVGERKIIRPENQNRAERREQRTDVYFRVNRRQRP